VPGLRVVVDTNVWVSGLILPDSPPGQVLQAVRDRRLDPVASWALAEEVAEVLRRPRIRKYGITQQDVEDVLFLLAPFLPSIEIQVPVRDRGDVPVIAAAIHGNARLIVTGDQDLLADRELATWLADRGIEVRTPADLLAHLDERGRP
jgi:putative PIN family toxin of toxin-antitoxin system